MEPQGVHEEHVNTVHLAVRVAFSTCSLCRLCITATGVSTRPCLGHPASPIAPEVRGAQIGPSNPKDPRALNTKYIPQTIAAIPSTETTDALSFGTLGP